MMGRDTLLTATIGDQGTLRKLALVLGGALFIALAAKVTVPMWPVPVSLQTLAILLVGLSMGSRLGAATVAVYVAQGAMGLPVFTPTTLPGIAGLMGPTGGFLIGFIGMAWLAGLAVERGLARGVLSTALVALAVSAALYVPGVLWPMALAAVAGLDAGWIGQGAGFYWAHFVAPFLLGDALKAVIAALVVTGAWAALRRRA
jgi:biotin transport system substrate-specific component